jgi:hypothetical protein
MPLPKQLFAVVSHAAAAPTLRPHRNVDQLKREKLAELKAKRAVDRVNGILDCLDARCEAIAAEIKALERRKKLFSGRAEAIKARIVEELEANALTRADGFHTSVLITPSPAAVEILDAKLVPAAYLRDPKPAAAAPDKVQIKAALERGEAVPGCKLVQGVTLRRNN